MRLEGIYMLSENKKTSVTASNDYQRKLAIAPPRRATAPNWSLSAEAPLVVVPLVSELEEEEEDLVLLEVVVTKLPLEVGRTVASRRGWVSMAPEPTMRNSPMEGMPLMVTNLL